MTAELSSEGSAVQTEKGTTNAANGTIPTNAEGSSVAKNSKGGKSEKNAVIVASPTQPMRRDATGCDGQTKQIACIGPCRHQIGPKDITADNGKQCDYQGR